MKLIFVLLGLLSFAPIANFLLADQIIESFQSWELFYSALNVFFFISCCWYYFKSSWPTKTEWIWFGGFFAFVRNASALLNGNSEWPLTHAQGHLKILDRKQSSAIDFSLKGLIKSVFFFKSMIPFDSSSLCCSMLMFPTDLWETISRS